VTTETVVVICDECGEEIVPPESAVRMVQDHRAVAHIERRSRLVFHFHVDCAPEAIVGAWVLVED
jgi:hypothetical protein